MDKRDDGGPAFPGERVDMRFMDRAPGMSLRDYFAAQALAMFNPGIPRKIIAETAYALADAMLAERQKGGAR